MTLSIRPISETDIPAIVSLSLAAWEPVFVSFHHIMGENVFRVQYPDWKKTQQEEIEKVCRNPEKFDVYVADMDGQVVGFITNELNHETKIGEVYFLAVDPDYQNQGIGTKLNLFALEKMKEAGMLAAAVGTGGDPGHAPARRSYEKAGYTPLPLVRYYKDLTENE